MQTLTTTPFGRRPVTADLIDRVARSNRPAPALAVDKWQVLTDLSIARAAYGLSDRTIGVLQALVSFHRVRELDADGPLIVFASNASLKKRAHGMPESTLRRHLALLVKAGMITRHDSPNGKRYARQGQGGEILRAFGFDLRPLVCRAGEIAESAAEQQRLLDQLAAMREEVVLLMRDAFKLQTYAEDAGAGVPDALADQLLLARRYLRRQLDLDALTTLRDELKIHVDRLIEMFTPEIEEPQETAVLSACDDQNERHIQESNTIISDSEKRTHPPCTLANVLSACPDVLPYADRRIIDWQDFVALMARMAPMTGVDTSTWAEACRSMGPPAAATALAGIVQRIGKVKSPGAYLRSLSQRARDGKFSVEPMIESLARAAA